MPVIPLVRRWVAAAIVRMGYFFMSWILTMAFCLLSLELSTWLWRAAGASPLQGISEESSHLRVWGAAGVSLVALIVGYLTARRGPRARHVELKYTQLPQPLRGLKIAQVSDLHLGPQNGPGFSINKTYVDRLASLLAREQPDIIVYTGDIFDGQPKEVRLAAEALKSLRPPLGSYFIFGNHEHYQHTKQWQQLAEDLGWKILADSHHLLPIQEVRLLLLGLQDRAVEWIQGVRLPRHLDCPKSDFFLLLVHQPDGWRRLGHENFQLQLSGHTHGGQFFPANLLVRLFHRYFRGLYQRGVDNWVYVNPGTGFWGPANRLLVPAEVTFLSLALKDHKLR